MRTHRRDLNLAILIAGGAILSLVEGLKAQVVINEIHYNPAERAPNLEFIEIFNAGQERLDLSYWHFEDAVEYTFPPGTMIEPDGFLVVAAEPEAFRGHYRVEALGPWSGSLKNEGESIVLLDGEGGKRNEVDYGAGFPWPTAAAGEGSSIELMHPSLDNGLAGSWRSSIPPGASDVVRTFVAAEDENWLYRKGTSTPTRSPSAWRRPGFSPDKTWNKGRAPIGYSDGDDNTVIDDMPNGYTTVYLLHTFQIEKDAIPAQVLLRVYSDDGAIVWINGVEVARLRAQPGEQPHTALASANHEAAWEELILSGADRFLRKGDNVLAIHALNGTLDSSDFSIDAELRTVPPSAIAAVPTPGARNSVFAEMAPPHVGQVRHEPASPKPGEAVRVTAEVSDPDGLRRVTLEYQVVAPGGYIRGDDPRYESEWRSVEMTNIETKDDAFTAQVPSGPQRHRGLVRYRVVAEDTGGNRVRAPYPDDPQRNFAWFCYGEMPGWKAADQPGRTAEKTFSPDLMRSMPAIHLIAREKDVIDSQFEWSHNEQFLPGTVVFEGKVYDHVRFRNRGETTTYMTGKNKWRFNFNRTHEIKPALDYAHGTIKPWRRLNLNPGTIPYDPAFRGTSALNERLGFRLHQLAGLPACDTWYAQLRVVDGKDETGDDQYSGDLWGLYLGFEAIDGRFLDNHGLPDGGLYKIAQSGIIERQTDSASDRAAFVDFWRGTQLRQPEAWWRRNVDLERYYTYHALSIAVARYDQKLNHNYSLYHHPERGWLPIPWDLDMCLWPVRYQAGDFRWQTQLKYSVLTSPALNREYQNRARELLDLLFTPDQISALVDEVAYPLRSIDGGDFAEADQYLWNFHPRAAAGHRGTYFQNPIQPVNSDVRIEYETNDIRGRVQYFKDYLTNARKPGAARSGTAFHGWGYGQLAADCIGRGLPVTPAISALKADSDNLTFACSTPGVPVSVGSHEWRVAEVCLPGMENYQPGELNRYEIESAWRSTGDAFLGELTIPAWELKAGRRYRIRSRFIDRQGVAGHWSQPVEFTAPQADVRPYAALTITEIMYHPAPPKAALSATSVQASDYEFIELTNLGDTDVDLTPLRFTSGIDFEFSAARIQKLKPGQRLVVARNAAAFCAKYPGKTTYLAGAWGGARLSDKGETIVLSLGAHTPVRSVDYLDRNGWPEEADGAGASLEWDESTTTAGWRASDQAGGSPGQ